MLNELKPDEVQALLAQTAVTLDGIYTPFQIVRLVYDNSLHGYLLKAFEQIGWKEDDADLFLDSIAQDAVNDPLPSEYLQYLVPLLVMLHDTFGCCENGSPLPEPAAQEIASLIPCIRATFELKWPVGSDTYTLVFFSDQCKHRRRNAETYK